MKNITHKKVVHAVANMCRELGMAGSISGQYDLYSAVWKEIEQGRKNHETMQQMWK